MLIGSGRIMPTVHDGVHASPTREACSLGTLLTPRLPREERLHHDVQHLAKAHAHRQRLGRVRGRVRVSAQAHAHRQRLQQVVRVRVRVGVRGRGRGRGKVGVGLDLEQVLAVLDESQPPTTSTKSRVGCSC